MSAHTPGPWEANGHAVDTENGSVYNIATCDKARIPIGWSGTDYTTETYQRANARLIAAAPDLLAALQKVMSWIENWNPEFSNDEEWPSDRDDAIAAIAKATGV